MIFKSYLSAYKQYDLNNNTQGINSLKDNCIFVSYATCIIMPNSSLCIIKLLTVHVLNFFQVLLIWKITILLLQLWSFAILVRAIYHLTMLAVPHLVNTKGNIVNVSSINGIRCVSRLSWLISDHSLWILIIYF